MCSLWGRWQLSYLLDGASVAAFGPGAHNVYIVVKAAHTHNALLLAYKVCWLPPLALHGQLSCAHHYHEKSRPRPRYCKPHSLLSVCLTNCSSLVWVQHQLIIHVVLLAKTKLLLKPNQLILKTNENVSQHWFPMGKILGHSDCTLGTNYVLSVFFQVLASKRSQYWNQWDALASLQRNSDSGFAKRRWNHVPRPNSGDLRVAK